MSQIEKGPDVYDDTVHKNEDAIGNLSQRK
jgi:hypothetical protein